jgi:hypothetical protein
MGLLARLARGPLGGAAIGAGVGGAGGGVLSGGDPNAIGMGALLGAGQGLGLGAVGAAARREALDQVSLGGKNAQQIAQFILSQGSREDAEFYLRHLKYTDGHLFRQVQQILGAP